MGAEVDCDVPAEDGDRRHEEGGHLKDFLDRWIL
jgi:hypothetical protein